MTVPGTVPPPLLAALRCRRRNGARHRHAEYRTPEPGTSLRADLRDQWCVHALCIEARARELAAATTERARGFEVAQIQTARRRELRRIVRHVERLSRGLHQTIRAHRRR